LEYRLIIIFSPLVLDNGETLNQAYLMQAEPALQVKKRPVDTGLLK
jgi:hypothetical protein